jgi:hypothetical protein
MAPMITPNGDKQFHMQEAELGDEEIAAIPPKSLQVYVSNIENAAR